MANFKNEIRLLIDKLRPKYENNTDPLIFDYDFYTNLEKHAKKERENALNRLIADKPVEEGRIVKGKMWALDLKITPMNLFDKETFIDKILQKYKNVERHVLRELAGVSLKSSERKYYTAVNREDE